MLLNHKTKLVIGFSFAIVFLFFSFRPALAVTNIDSVSKWAWNDVVGWINFFSTNTVNVSATGMNGYAVFENDAAAFVAFDCATSPNGNICATSNFTITNGGSGNLSGWAWNDTIGWISFNCNNSGIGNTCATSNYSVNVNSAGDFSGWAWNDTVGWISFCGNASVGSTLSGSIWVCPTSPTYKVKTTWTSPASGSLISSTFDTGYSSGVAYNSIIWQGTLPSGGVVRFQLATSNCSNGATNPSVCDANVGWGGSKTSGDGAFLGDGGNSVTYYQPTGPNSPSQIVGIYHNNKRYYRYKVFIDKGGGSTSPIVDDVIVNWNP